MENIHITRNLDELGRIVIPIELRKKLNLHEKDPVQISIKNDSIILQKKQNTCVFCNSIEHLEKFNFQYICTDCKKKIKEVMWYE